MEANLFRCLAAALGPLLAGRRIEKLHGPAPGVWTLTLQAAGGAPYVLLRVGRGEGLLLASDHKPENPADPSARCMWLRKRLTGRRLLGWTADWPARLLALELSPGPGRWLVLGPGGEPDLADALPAGFGAEPSWPEAARVRDDPGVWREHPQITRELRRLLAALPPGRDQAVLDAVRRGGCARFFAYLPEAGPGGGSGPARPRLLAWRLPPELRAGLAEHVFDDVVEAAGFFGRAVLFPQLRARAEAASQKRLDAARARALRALESLEADRARLEALAARSQDAQDLRGALYLFDKHGKRPYLDAPRGDGSVRRIALDQRLTLLENMERLFRLAAKGRRGLDFLAGREERLRAELAAAERGELPPGREGGAARPADRHTVERPAGAVPGVARFRTSDGFVVLRGKSARANHDLRKLASPFDLWFHAADGPGAHVVLRRDFPDQAVPEASLAEAAGLAALRSHAAGGRAEVLCAQVRHVRAITGGGPGKVAVDRLERTLAVDPDPDLEARLAEAGP
ncbi:NFACT RNA binding domain-containing protein [Desulfocurvus sp.]|uniref:NFACT RNA binding domain-containing protein n=1 Tax=Desulfocurvus sp. TaxID=2871698 RepID=UPI0025C3D62E|nr:NFACT RNA binding domain-containing protein [Desulfocurvus sp.]MCK9240095.1 NFACT RNA binding domain-containing protein [Desulfocurvus sp.]